MLGLPVDENDERKALEDYAAKYKPPYSLQYDLGKKERSAVTSLLEETLGTEALPSTIITDGKGRVFSTMLGVPSVSEVRRILTRLNNGKG